MKMWDGRFTKQTERLMELFNNSLPVDKALIEEDISGSVAWARALQRCGILTQQECDSIVKGLESIRADHHNGALQFAATDEDIHMAVERILIERIGDVGAKLHTGRSRNDQVATDFRLFVMKSVERIMGCLTELQRTLLDRAQNDREVIMPGYTHLQQAQPVLLSHYWLSMFWILERDKSRCSHSIETAGLLPLGSGALAGAGFPIDRQFLAQELRFPKVSPNSMDAVASRDFVLEALSTIASIGIHVSRYAEDLIIWSSREFGFVELDDAWSTGSSMMPQKKNPDSLELIRGKCGRFIGNYTRMATILKGIGLTYYKDLQEDKEAFLDSSAQIVQVLQVMTEVIKTLLLKKERIAEDLDPLLIATDLADYLVVKGLPFRQAHKVVGKIVGHCIQSGTPLDTLSVGELRTFSPLFDDDIASTLSWKAAIAHRDVAGGTGRNSVDQQIQDAQKILKN